MPGLIVSESGFLANILYIYTVLHSPGHIMILIILRLSRAAPSGSLVYANSLLSASFIFPAISVSSSTVAFFSSPCI